MRSAMFRYALYTLSMLPMCAWAGINLPWSTTFNCNEWLQNKGGLSCDGITETGGSWDCGGPGQTIQGEQITSGANYSGGKGGRGQRHWLGSARGDNSGGLQIRFNAGQSEFWARWYVRFQEGLDVTGMDMHYKMLYLHGTGTQYIGAINFPYGSGDGIRYYEQSGGKKNLKTDVGGWYSVYGNGVSDGRWFRVDVHYKHETSGANGQFKLWVDGKKVIDREDAQFGANGKFTGFLMGSNHKGHRNNSCMYVDYDDIAISNIGYIGAINGGGPPPPNAPPAPVKNLKVK